VHDPAPLNEPVPLLEKLTVPVGVVLVPVSVSETVAVHVDGSPTGTDPGVHDIAVEVDRPPPESTVADTLRRQPGPEGETGS
jgi:hypothetical protein